MRKIKKLETRNALQSLAYSPLGAIVSPLANACEKHLLTDHLVISQILPKISCHGNVPKGIKKDVRIEKIHANTFHLLKRS